MNESRTMTGRFWLALAFALLAQAVPAIMIYSAQRSFGQVSDLPEYYAAARMAAQKSGAYIYDLERLGAEQKYLFPTMGERIVGLYVPPPSLPWLLPLAFLPAGLAPSVWISLLILALTLSFLLIKRLFQLTWTETLAICAVVSVSGPQYESLRIGQPAPLLLLFLLLSFWAMKMNRPLAAAVAMSFLILKPQELLPVLAYLVGARRWRTLLFFAGFSLFLLALSFFILGVDGWVKYFQLIESSMHDTSFMQPELSPTLRGQLLRFFPKEKALVTILSLFACAGALFANFLSGRKYMRFRQCLELGLATALPIGLVTALHCHDYDFLLMVPSAVAAYKLKLFERVPEWLKLAGIAAMTTVLLPLYVFIHYDYLLKGGLVNPLFFLALALSIACIILAHRNRLDLLLQEEPEP